MTYSFPLYVPAAAVAVSVIALIAGILFCRSRSLRPFAVVAFFFSIIAGPLIAPMLARDRVVLDDQKLEQTTGFWFAPTIKGFSLTNITSVTITVARGRRNRAIELWTADYSNGTAQTVDPGDLWDLNAQDIIRQLRARGIVVNEPENR